MRAMSIQSKLYTVIVLIILIVSSFALSHYLRTIQHSVDQKHSEISEFDQRSSDIFFNEKAALIELSHQNKLPGKYTSLKKMCANCHSGSGSSILTERQTTFNELFGIFEKTKKAYTDVKTRLMDLLSSVKYIHEHHIAYLKNLMRRNVPIQDYYTDKAFERSPIKSATEPDIIKSAVAIQISLVSIYDTFYNLQHSNDLTNIKQKFSDKIRQFFVSVNTFEDYSLDAQDGILVEELLQNGRHFENLFMNLLAAEQKKRILDEKLEQNRARLIGALNTAKTTIEVQRKKTSRQIEIIQMITLVFTILLGCWIVFTGKQIINQVRRTVAETNKIQKDLSYRIDIDDSILEEFKVGFKALNSMAAAIGDHIKKLDSAQIELETRVKERTTDLAKANEVLRNEIMVREKTEGALKESEERLRNLIEQSPFSIQIMDTNGNMVQVNKAAEKLWGLSWEELVESGGYNILQDEQLKKLGITPYLEKGFSGEATTIPPVEYDARETIGEGRKRSVSSRIYPVKDESGNIRNVILMHEDVTERKRAEDALRRSEEKLQRSKKMESLGLLAGGVAHDLNNVLTGIVGYPDLILLDLPEDSKLRNPIETIRESGHRATAIVQDLLTVARGVATAKEPLNLNDIINGYLNSPEFRKIEHYNPMVRVKTVLDANLLNIGGSPIHVRKVVMNLISNAAEAIDGKGNITISTRNHYADRPLRGYDDVNIGEYAVLSVSDDGSGISSDDLERIFEPFYTKKVMGRSGTGLGLAVVWNTVQDHNGYIDVRSDENGTKFELYFPITRAEVMDQSLSVPFQDYKGNGETILVVDDVESQREISCKMLDTLGYNASAVSSGEEAVEYLAKHEVDLVVLDMIMDPGINGRETYERIININPKQKAIILSGFAETDDVKGAQQLGAGKYIRKPVTLEKIGLAVKEELEKS